MRREAASMALPIPFSKPRRTPSAATREKIRVAHLGMRHTDETKAKLRQLNIGKKRSPITDETRAKIRIANTGYKHSDAAKAKMSVSQKKRRATENAAPS